MEVCEEVQQKFPLFAESHSGSLTFLRDGASQVTPLQLAVSGVIQQLRRKVSTLQQQCAEREALLNDTLLALRRRASKRRQKENQGWVTYSRLRSNDAASSVAPPGGLVSDQALQKVVAGLQFDWQVGCELLRKMRCKWALAALFGARQVAQARRTLAEEALWRQKERLLRPCFWALWRNVLRRRTKLTATARPRAIALSFFRCCTLERFFCRWIAYSSRRIMLRAMGEAAIERLRCRVLRKGLEGWGAWRERKVWERDAVERAWEWKVRRSLRLCFLGWQSEAGKRRVLLDRLLSPGARKTGTERVVTALHNQTSPSWPPKKASHLAPLSVSHVAAEDLSSPRGPLEPGVSRWAVALLRKLDSSIDVPPPPSLAGLRSVLKEKQGYGQFHPAFASASAGNLWNGQGQEIITGANTSASSTGLFTLEDACEKYHARSLARRALLAWKTECEHARRTLDFARASGNRSRATRVFRSWLSSFRRRKNIAGSHWRAAVVARVFTLWRKRARQCTLLRERLEATLRGRRHRALSLALWGWREWGVNMRRQRKRIAGVEVEIVHRRLEVAFEAWRKEAARKGRKRHAVRKGLTAGLGRVWRHWAQRARARVLLRRVLAAAEARWTLAALFPSHHSEFQAALVCFATWRAFTLRRAADRAEVVRTGAADVYNRARLLTKAFRVLRSPVDDHRSQREAKLFRRKILWAWRNWAERKRDGPTARVMARFRVAAGGLTVGEYIRARVLRGFLRVWKRVTEEKRARAEAYRARSCVRRALLGWVKVRGESLERVAVHTKRWERVKLSGVLNEWKRMGLERKERKRKVELGKKRVGRRLKAAGVAAWKAYCESRRQKRSVSFLARQYATLLLKRHTVRSWLGRLAWRDLKERANQLREHRLKRATWRALIRHTRDSQVVRDLVNGSRTRGASGATNLHGPRARVSLLGSGRETPRSGQRTPKSGRETPKMGRGTPKAALETSKPGREAPKRAWEEPKPIPTPPEAGSEEPASCRETSMPPRENPKSGRERTEVGFETPKPGPNSSRSGREESTSARGTPNTATSFGAGQVPRSPLTVPPRSRFAVMGKGETRVPRRKEAARSSFGLRKKGASGPGGSNALSKEGEGKGGEQGVARSEGASERGVSGVDAGRPTGRHVAGAKTASVEGPVLAPSVRRSDNGKKGPEQDVTVAEEVAGVMTSAAGSEAAVTSTGVASGNLEAEGRLDELDQTFQEAAELGVEGSREKKQDGSQESETDRLLADRSGGSESVALGSEPIESESGVDINFAECGAGGFDLSRGSSGEKSAALSEGETMVPIAETRGESLERSGEREVGEDDSGRLLGLAHVTADVSALRRETDLRKLAEAARVPRPGLPGRDLSLGTAHVTADVSALRRETDLWELADADGGPRRGVYESGFGEVTGAQVASAEVTEGGDVYAGGARSGHPGEGASARQTGTKGGEEDQEVSRSRNRSETEMGLGRREREKRGILRGSMNVEKMADRKWPRKSTGMLVSARGAKRPRRHSHVENRTREVTLTQEDKHRRRSVSARGGLKSLGAGSRKDGVGVGANPVVGLAVLSPESVGGLSPWGGPESVWSPEGIVPRSGFDPPGSGCPPERNAPGGFSAGPSVPLEAESVCSPEGIVFPRGFVPLGSGYPPERDPPGGILTSTSCPPEDNTGTGLVRNGETSLVADHPDLGETGPRAKQRATVSSTEWGGGTRVSRSLTEAEPLELGLRGEGFAQKGVSRSANSGEEVPQGRTNGTGRNGEGAEGRAEAAGERGAAGGLQAAMCEGGRNPVTRDSGTEQNGTEEVFGALREPDSVEMEGDEAGDPSWAQIGMDQSRVGGASGLGRGSLGNGHVVSSRQFDGQSNGQFDGQFGGQLNRYSGGHSINEQFDGHSDRGTREKEQGDAERFSRGVDRTAWARHPKQIASLDGNGFEERQATESLARLEPLSICQERGSGAEQERDFLYREEGQPPLQLADGCEEALGGSGKAPRRGSVSSADEGSDQSERGLSSLGDESEGRVGVDLRELGDVKGEGLAARGVTAEPPSSAGSSRSSRRSMDGGRPGAPSGLKAEAKEAGVFPPVLETEEPKSRSSQRDGNAIIRESGNRVIGPLLERVEMEHSYEAVTPVRQPLTAAAVGEQGRERKLATSGPGAVMKSAARWPPERLPRGAAGLATGAPESEAVGKTRHGSLVKWPPGAFEGSGSRRTSGLGHENGNSKLPPGVESPGAKRRRASAPAIAVEAAREMPTGPELVRGFRVVEPECALGPKHCNNRTAEGITDLH